MLIACQLAKAGYFNGSPECVLNAPVNMVYNILNYEEFESDYIKAYSELNKDNEQ